MTSSLKKLISKRYLGFGPSPEANGDINRIRITTFDFADFGRRLDLEFERDGKTQRMSMEAAHAIESGIVNLKALKKIIPPNILY